MIKNSLSAELEMLLDGRGRPPIPPYRQLRAPAPSAELSNGMVSCPRMRTRRPPSPCSKGKADATSR